eukprot:244904_1
MASANFGAYLILFTGGIITLLLLYIVTKSMVYLLCKKSLQTDSKKTVNVITTKNKQKMKRMKLNITYHPLIRYSAIFSLLAYFICNICAMTDMIMITMQYQLNSTRKIFQNVGVFLWIIGRIFMNLVFLSRLKFSFQGTPYSYGKCVFKLLYCFFSLFPICICFNIIWIPIGSIVSEETSTMISALVNFSIITFDQIFGILMSILFQKKLFELIKSYSGALRSFSKLQQTDIDTDKDLKDIKDLNDLEFTLNDTFEMASIQKFQDNNLNKFDKYDMDSQLSQVNHTLSNSLAANNEEETVTNQDIIEPEQNKKVKTKNKRVQKFDQAMTETKEAFIHTVAQYTILISLFVISSFVVVINGAVTGITAKEKSESEQLYILFIYEYILAIDAAINSFMLFLHFAFSIKLYKWLCKSKVCPHRMCVSMYTKCV